MTAVMAKYTNADIRADIDFDRYDAWGSVMGALFDLCDAWYAHCGVRAHEDYEPSMWIKERGISSLEYRSRMWAGFMRQGDITSAQVDYWVRVLVRLRDYLEANGRSY